MISIWLPYYALFETMHFLKLQSKKQTENISLARADSVLFKGECRILKVFPSPIILSIWTLLLAILRSFKTFSWLIRFCFLKKEGILTFTLIGIKRSSTVNPLSTMTESPGSNFWQMLLLSIHQFNQKLWTV